MQVEPTVRVPLRDRQGDVVAEALLDPQDALLAERRWYLDTAKPRSGKRYARRGGDPAIYLHREVLDLPPHDPRKGDHINGDTLDCRRSNLRVVTNAQNAQNQGSRGGSSAYRGVTWDKSRGKWMASATLNGRRTTIGRFDSELDAHRAAVVWRREHMPYAIEEAA